MSNELSSIDRALANLDKATEALQAQRSEIDQQLTRIGQQRQWLEDTRVSALRYAQTLPPGLRDKMLRDTAKYVERHTTPLSESDQLASTNEAEEVTVPTASKLPGIRTDFLQPLRAVFTASSLPGNDLQAAFNQAVPGFDERIYVARSKGDDQVRLTYAEDLGLGFEGSMVLKQLRQAANLLQQAEAGQPVSAQVAKLHREITSLHSFGSISKVFKVWGLIEN